MYCIYSVSVALYFVVMTKAKSLKPSKKFVYSLKSVSRSKAHVDMSSHDRLYKFMVTRALGTREDPN